MVQVFGLRRFGTFTYAYGAENRLTGITQGGTTIASYAYDAQGRRKAKTVGSTKTVFVTDADNREILEYDGTSGAVKAWYTYGLGSNEVLARTDVAAGTRQTMILDVLGSIIGTVDSGTGVVTKIGYQAFGENPALASGNFNYTAQRFDPETAGSAGEPSGLYYYRARMYSPVLGRFLQPDPVGYSEGGNLYAYVGNDPLSQIDPFGLASDSPNGSSSGSIWGEIGRGFAEFPQDVRAGLSKMGSDLTKLFNQAKNDPLGAVAEVSSWAAPLAPELSSIQALRGATAGAQEAATALRFSQSTASPYFSSEGAFAGQSIANVAGQIRTGSITASQVPVQTIDLGAGPLIVNTRSSLALMQAGVPQSEWTIINLTGDAATKAQISQRLINNGLSTGGTNVLRITGSGRSTSTIIPGH